MSREPLVVDVREDLRQGRQPLGKILQAVRALAGGQDLVLRASFEPVPLYRVLAARGFAHQSRRLADGDWEVRFVRRPGRRAAASGSAPVPPRGAGPAPSTGVAPSEATAPWSRLDNRGLEPPEPMIRTFAALDALPAGEVLEIHNDRRPMFLYPHLQERGFRYETVDEPDGSARVRIWMPDTGSD
jgi:uncharacterized protein (DUF2249 family)